MYLEAVVDATLDLVLRFKTADLGGDKPEHDMAVLRNELERLKTAAPVGVILHEVAVEP
jgi:hypothetical protein